MLNIPSIKPIAGYEKHISLLNFLIRLNVFSIPLYAILLLDLSLPQLQRIIADITFLLLNASGMNPVINDLLISIPIKNGSWGAFINWDCTAWKSILAFFALVMATDKVSSAKMKGGMIFIPLIFIINLVRIFFMFFYVKTFDIAYYSVVHTVVWSWGMIFVILAFWFLWMKKMS